MTDADLERLLTLDSSPGPALTLDAADADAIIEAALVGAGYGAGPGPSSGGASGAGRAGMATGTKLAIVGLRRTIALGRLRRRLVCGPQRARHARRLPQQAACGDVFGRLRRWMKTDGGQDGETAEARTKNRRAG